MNTSSPVFWQIGQLSAMADATHLLPTLSSSLSAVPRLVALRPPRGRALRVKHHHRARRRIKRDKRARERGVQFSGRPSVYTISGCVGRRRDRSGTAEAHAREVFEDEDGMCLRTSLCDDRPARRRSS